MTHVAVKLNAMRPDILPEITRFVYVAGVNLTVQVYREGTGWLAWHIETGCWGYGVTIECAVRDIALMLANEHDWFVVGEGSRMYLHGRMYERRAAIQKTFGGAA